MESVLAIEVAEGELVDGEDSRFVYPGLEVLLVVENDQNLDLMIEVQEEHLTPAFVVLTLWNPTSVNAEAQVALVDVRDGWALYHLQKGLCPCEEEVHLKISFALHYPPMVCLSAEENFGLQKYYPGTWMENQTAYIVTVMS